LNLSIPWVASANRGPTPAGSPKPPVNRPPCPLHGGHHPWRRLPARKSPVRTSTCPGLSGPIMRLESARTDMPPRDRRQSHSPGGPALQAATDASQGMSGPPAGNDQNSKWR
jgi:hypothetical protein